ETIDGTAAPVEARTKAAMRMTSLRPRLGTGMRDRGGRCASVRMMDLLRSTGGDAPRVLDALVFMRTGTISKKFFVVKVTFGEFLLTCRGLSPSGAGRSRSK